MKGQPEHNRKVYEDAQNDSWTKPVASLSLRGLPVLAGKSEFKDFVQLPAVKMEINSIEKLFKKHHMVAFVVYDTSIGPSINDIVNDLLNASIVHIASHSCIAGAIVLSEVDGKESTLLPKDIYKKFAASGKLRPSLVVLNCCFDQKRDPLVDDLARALLTCGIPCVIHTIGTVHDDAANELLTCFYETLLETNSNESPEDCCDSVNALRTAMIRTMKLGAHKYEPKDWLAYVASGLKVGLKGNI